MRARSPSRGPSRRIWTGLLLRNGPNPMSNSDPVPRGKFAMPQHSPITKFQAAVEARDLEALRSALRECYGACLIARWVQGVRAIPRRVMEARELDRGGWGWHRGSLPNSDAWPGR